ncbi:trypsin-like serine protease [Streptomyces sp. NPDC020490]|uniref:trypsin-like serine protease n=1 Tax=Streptomyces sp. NPDC020490 TaxID=3365078 RepID=UPI0037BAED69
MFGLTRVRKIRTDSGRANSCGPDLVRPHTICAGHTSGGFDTCQDDSGGPLLVRGVLAGITSPGETARRPVTRVSTPG